MNLQVRQQSKTATLDTKSIGNIRSGLEGLEDFGKDLNFLNDLLERVCLAAGDNTKRACERLQKDITAFEPTITVLGQVKSGKTTLVNAMAGWPDLLPSDVNPWTSVVTSLHLSPGANPAERGATFRFMKEVDWKRLLNQGGRIGEMASRAGAESELKKIGEQVEKVRTKAQNRLGRKFDLLLGETHDYGYFDKNLLERYIVMGDEFDAEDGEHADQGRFADIVSSADLYLNSQTVPMPMCLRDTPGVNDTFMMREQVTIQAIRESKICVVVLSAGQALTSVDMGLIRLISNLKSRNVLIFVNRIDELSNPAEQVPEIEASIRQTLRDKNGPEDAEILFGSAYWAYKVLSGSIEGMPEISSQALLNWAEALVEPLNSQTNPDEMVWELSGISSLFRAISQRILEDQAAPLLRGTSENALTIVTSQLAAGMVQIAAEQNRSGTVNNLDASQSFEKLAKFHLSAFDQELGSVISDFHVRADRAQDKFIDRALRSLLSHLENYGNQVMWDYDPIGLRMLLRSAYTVFGANVRATYGARIEAALTDVASLYADSFGSAVQGIQMASPSLPNIPAPVAFGQTIALDFNDGWWISWWNRIRGYNAFAKRFQNLIARETEDFMRQSKDRQAQDVRKMAMLTLEEFFAQHRDIVAEITSRSTGQDIQNLFHSGEEGQKRTHLNNLLTELEGFQNRLSARLERIGA